MSNNFGNDLTIGSIPKHLLKFSVPMLLGNLMQSGYSIINMIWVGNMVGTNAVAAVQSSLPIIFILVGLVNGATLATTIQVSQAYGAKDYKKVERVVNNSFSIMLMLGAALSIIGIFASDFLLRLLNTPESTFPIASSYLKLSLAGFLFVFFGFLIASILRGIGDTTTPLAFMGIGLGLNAILDPILIMGVGPFPELGLNGAAYASIISQTLALVISIIYLNKKSHLVAFHPAKLIIDRKMTADLFKLAFPSMVQQSFISIGSAFIQGFVNGFGEIATAAFGAAGRLENVVFMPAMSIGMAASALTGQNIGAGKIHKTKEILKWGVVMTLSITIVLSATMIAVPRQLLSMFVHEKSVLDIGVQYLRIVGLGYAFLAVNFVVSGILNGAGKTFVTMVFSLVSLWIIRVPMAAILSKPLGPAGIWIAIDTSWIITLMVVLAFYFSGKWKPAMNKGPAAAPHIPQPEQVL